MLKRIIFTVTNDLSYDQRMQRICDTLASNGYQVLLVGRKRKDAIPLTKQAFDQRRIFCFWNKGPLFYVEYNIRLLLFLLTNRADIVCAIDLDTVLPCYFSSIIKKQIRYTMRMNCLQNNLKLSAPRYPPHMGYGLKSLP